MRSRRVVVCGATGMVGSHLVAELLRSGYSSVAVVVRRGSSLEALERRLQYYFGGEQGLSRVEVHYSRLDDVASLSAIFTGRDLLFNCAAKVDFSPRGGQSLVHTNTIIVTSIVEAAHRASLKHIVHVGSIASLSSRGEGLTDESHHLTTLDGHSPYAVSKFFSDAQIERASLYGITTTIVQPSVVLGSGSWTGGHISSLFRMVDRGMRLYFSGITGYVDVEDVARAMVTVSEEPQAAGGRFILNSENLSYRELFEKIASSLGVKAPSRKVHWLAVRALEGLCRSAENIGLRLSINSFTLRCLYSESRYDGSKIERLTPFRYSPLSQGIDRIAKEYRQKRG